MTSRPRPAWAQALALSFGLAVGILVVFTCFALPGVKSGPNQVPIGLAAPSALADPIEQALTTRSPDAFEIHRYTDAAALEAAIRDREVYGGLTLDPNTNRPVMLTATAGSPGVAQLLTQMATTMGTQPAQQPVTPPGTPSTGTPPTAGTPPTTGTPSTTGTPPTAGTPPASAPMTIEVRDVVPLPEADPRGAGLAGAAFPIAIGGAAPALLLFTRFRDRYDVQVVGSLIVAGLVGVGATIILQSWFGSIQDVFWPVAGGLTLGIAAIALPLVALGALAGRPGVGLGALVILFLGNPLSGMAAGPEMLPAGWGTLGQFLPPGANATLLRSTAFFDNGGAGGPALVLVVYVLAALLLIGVAASAGRRRRKAAPVG